MDPQNLPQEPDAETQLLKSAAILLNPKIKTYKFEGIDEILNSDEFPIDFPVTDTQMSSFSYACTFPDGTPQRKAANLKLLQAID